MKLVIFDLDQTLVDLLPVHNRAMQLVFGKHFSKDALLSEIDFAGKSLTEIFIELCHLKGIPQDMVTKNIKELLESFEMAFIGNVPEDASNYVLPGAKELLKSLSKTDNIIALYTGNSPKIIRKVLAATGLKKYFRFFLSGTEVETRADMVKLCRPSAIMGQI